MLAFDLQVTNNLIIDFLGRVINEKIILDFDTFIHFFL